MLQGVLVDLVPYDDEFEARTVAWMNGPMREWWAMDGLMTQAGHQRWLERNRARPEAERQQVVQLGILAKDGTPIGSFNLVNINPTHRYAEVGAGIGDPAYWGGGFGSDAMLLLTDYAFNWLDLRRLWLRTSGRNARAQRQVEKCGYTLEARRREQEYYEGYHDLVYYGLLQSDWPGYAVMAERLDLREKARERGFSGA